MNSLRYFIAAICLFLFSNTCAFAHDRFEGTIDLHSSAECLEVTVIVPAATVSVLLKSTENKLVTKDTLATHRPALLASADALCSLHDGKTKALQPSRIELSLGENGELCYLFEYPAATQPASLSVALLNSLPNQHFFVVSDHRAKPARRAVLIQGKASLDLIPAANPNAP
jgi:hypothetical protein